MIKGLNNLLDVEKVFFWPPPVRRPPQSSVYISMISNRKTQKRNVIVGAALGVDIANA